AQSLLLLGGMVALLSACGWILGGPGGIVWALIAGGLSLSFSPRISPALVLRLYRARLLHLAEVPAVHSVVARIVDRAGCRGCRLFTTSQAGCSTLSPSDKAKRRRLR